MPTGRWYAAATAALALSLTLVGAAAAEEPTRSPNVTHVLNHPHRARAVEGSLSGGGTDIEFATLSVAARDASGTPICFDKRGRPVTSGKPCS
jgi:hypothetical protein